MAPKRSNSENDKGDNKPKIKKESTGVKPKNELKKTLTPIEGINDSDIARSSVELKDPKTNKNNRSMCMNWLDKRGELMAYEAAPLATRKMFMKQYHALKRKESDNITALNTHVISNTSKNREKERWLNKFQLTKDFGVDACIVKIDAANTRHTVAKPRHRPEKSSGVDAEWITTPFQHNTRRRHRR